MASGTISTRPPAESAQSQGRYEDFIQTRLEHTRRQVRLVDVATSLMLLVIASLLFFLVAAVLDQWVFSHGLNFLARLALFVLWIGGAGTFVWRFLVPPLANRINPVFAAQTIEQSRPSLKNSLINFLLLRSHQQDVAPVVYRAMEHRAAADLLETPVDHALDRSRIVYLACALAAMIGIFALYLALSPKNPLISAGRVLWPWSSVPAPTRVHIMEITPGDAEVFNDDRQEISAQVTGLRDGEDVALLVSTADGQLVDDRVVMTRVDDANHYRCELPSGGGGFQQDTFYRLTAGDATTKQYKLDVQIAPTITVDKIDYHFPPYTEKDDRTIAGQGDIKALEGTRVTIHATANRDIREAKIDLGCAGLRTLSMTSNGTKATGQFTLALDSDNDGKAQYDCYQILFTDTDGHSVRRPIRYHIDVDRDLMPTIEIVEPQQTEVTVTEGGRVPIRVRAFDPDFGLRYVTLAAEREAQPGRSAEKLALPVLLDRTKPAKALSRPFDGERAGYVFLPATFNLKAGDRVRYWATADDNKEPHANHVSTESTPRTIRIVGTGASGQQDAQDPANHPDDHQQRDPSSPQGDKGEKGDKSQQGDGDPSNKADGSKASGQNSTEKSKQDGQDNKSSDQHSDKNDQGQPDKNSGTGNEKASSDPSKDQKSSEPNSGDVGDQTNSHRDPETERADAMKEILKDQQKQQKQDQPNQSQQSSDNSGRDQKQNSPQQGDNQQGNPQQGGQNQSGNAGGKQSQGDSGNKKDQNGQNQSGNSGGQKSQGGKNDAGQNHTGQPQQADQENSSGQGGQKSSPQQGGSDNPSNSGSQPQGGKDPSNPSSDKQSSPSDGGGQGNQSQPSSGSKQDQNSAGQAKPDSKQTGGDKSQQNDSSASGSKAQKPQPGGERGKDPSSGSGTSPSSEKPQSGGEQGKDQSASGGIPPQSEKKPGSQGGGDENQQLARGGQKPDDKKASNSSGGSDSSNMPGEKPGKKPGDKNGGSEGSGQSQKSQKEEKQDGGGQSAGGDKPKPGQGDQEGSSGGGKKPNGSKPGGNKGGTGDGEHEGQKDPGRNGEPTQQDSSGAPDSQVDREHTGQKAGNSHGSLDQKSDKAQSPGNSPHDSKSDSDAEGDRKGGGGGGGGQKDQKAGKGAAGTQTPAADGGSVSKDRNGDTTGKKAGEEVRSTDRTDSPRKEAGEGNGHEMQPANDQTAKTDSQKPQNDPSQNSTDNQNPSAGGQAGAQSSNQPGNQGSGLPAGGSQAGSNSATPPAPSNDSQNGPDAANLEFSKKQVDLALQHLKDEKDKPKSELLDRLGWTKEEAQRFLDNIKKLKDSAQQSKSEDDAAKKAYNEFLKNLDLHPHGTQIQGGRTRTDDLRNVRDSGQADVPSEWADQYRAYSHGTTEGKK